MMIRRATVLACLFAMLLLTACSSDSPTTADSSGSDTGPSSAPSGTAIDYDDFEAAPPTASKETEDEFLAAPPVITKEEPKPAKAVDGPYWPCFHGPNGDNISSDTGLLREWPDEGPSLDWKCEEIGNGYSGVSIADGLIYTAGNKDGNTLISAINMDGNVQWQVANGAAYTASYPGTRGTPTIDGERLYHQSPVGNTICLNAKTGKKIWSVNSLETFQAKNLQWALAESLLIDGDRVITCPGGNAASVAALDKLTGETVWKAESTGEKTNYATPSLVEYDGLRMILTMSAKGFIGVNADTGELLFRHRFETKYDINALKPIFHNGQVFISGGYGTTGSEMLKVTVQGDGASVQKVWGSRKLDNQHGGVVLLDGHLYGAAHSFNNGKWICLEWATGDMKWAERGVGKGSLTYADGMFYLMSERSNVGLAQASPQGLEMVSQFRLPSGGKGASWAHPVVCGGRLYIRHDVRLFAYNVKASG